MGSNLVIVAVPDEDDRVWKVSSEKVPHLTLLFLGEAEKVTNLQQIVQFVEHAASTTLNRFYLPVDRRDVLGADEADVLFFKKNRYDFKAIRDFRATLLQEQNIKTAYDSVEQFEGWTPHLTLGYPATPAKPIPDDHIERFYSVDFNKIAVWTGDFEGPEFLLKDWWDEMSENDDVAMSSINQERVKAGLAALEHHGVKGMKWGIRKDLQGRDRWDPEGHSVAGDVAKALLLNGTGLGTALAMPANVRLGKRIGAKAKANAEIRDNAKADAQWKKGLQSTKKGIEVHNKAADEIDRKLDGFNSDKRWKDADGKSIDLNKNAEKMNEYNTAFEREIMNPAYANAAAVVHGSSPSGRYKFEIKDASTGLMKVTDTMEIEHAAVDDDFDVEIAFHILRDDEGGVVGFEWPAQGAAEHGEIFVDGLLHYGVKGMKWGVMRTKANLAKVDRLRKEADSLDKTAANARGATRARALKSKAERNRAHADALEKQVKSGNSDPVAVAPSATSRVPHGNKRKTKLDVEGGENHPAHEDAITVAEAKAKLAKSGTAALSNKELRDVANRVQLEQQVKQLVMPAGKKFVKNLLTNQGNQGANQFVAKKVTRRFVPA